MPNCYMQSCMPSCKPRLQSMWYQANSSHLNRSPHSGRLVLMFRLSSRTIYNAHTFTALEGWGSFSAGEEVPPRIGIGTEVASSTTEEHTRNDKMCSKRRVFKMCDATITWRRIRGVNREDCVWVLSSWDEKNQTFLRGSSACPLSQCIGFGQISHSWLYINDSEINNSIARRYYTDILSSIDLILKKCGQFTSNFPYCAPLPPYPLFEGWGV